MVGPVIRGSSGGDEQARHAGERLGHRIVSRPLGIGPGLAESADVAADQPRVHRLQAVVRITEAIEHAGTEVADEHVGAADQRVEGAPAERRAQIDREAALVAVVAAEMRAVEAAAEAAEGVAAVRVLDLDDVGAEVGEHHPGQRPGDHGRQLDDPDAGKRRRHLRWSVSMVPSLNGS